MVRHIALRTRHGCARCAISAPRTALHSTISSGRQSTEENGCLIDGIEHKHFPAALAPKKEPNEGAGESPALSYECEVGKDGT